MFSLTLLLMGFSWFSCAQTPKSYQNISNQEFKEMSSQKDVMILDVRTPAEFNSGRISGAILLDVNDYSFEQKLNKLDKNKTYLVYCQSGIRSAKASSILSNNGFTKVFNLSSGFRRWDGNIEK
jgi:rhodanese-related sulfurtransferase